MFGEDPGRYIIEVASGDDHRVIDRAKKSDVPTRGLGYVGGDEIAVGDGRGAYRFCEVSLADLRAAHEGTLPALMAR